MSIHLDQLEGRTSYRPRNRQKGGTEIERNTNNRRAAKERKMNLKEKVQALCKEKGVTAQKAECDLGFGKGYISKLNASVPNAANIQKMAAYFGVSVDYLVGNVSEPNFHLDNERILREINGQIKQKGGTQPMDDNLFARDIDAARVIQVIETKAMRGSGTPKQPIREVIQYWSFDGELLAENDPLGHFTGGTDSTSSNVSSA